jgi:hypothetical protein
MQARWVGFVLVAIAAACGASGSQGGASPEDGGAPDAAAGPDAVPTPDIDAGGLNFDSGVPAPQPWDGAIVSKIPETCAESIARASYIGCDYWPTVTLNPVYEKFDFAVAVSNPQPYDVTVQVSGGALTQTLTKVVSGLSVQAIVLPWVPQLKGPTFDQNTAVTDPGASRIVQKGAYHLLTSLPVSVYQFSALEYEIDGGAECPGFAATGHCYSYSNDASLLLPASITTGDYGVLAWPSFAATPGFFAVTSTVDNTHVTVYPSNRVQGIPSVGPAVMLRGDNYTYTLNAGDVLEMFADTGDIAVPVYTQDISGTILHADQQIIVFGGHGCTFIPQDKKACDHLESSMFPVQTLGSQYIVSLPHTPHGEHHWVRVMGLYDNTSVAFDPPVSGSNGTVLNTGEVLDLPDVDRSFAMVANGRIFVAQYMLGEYDLVTDGGTPVPDLGDPSESPAISVIQYRDTYTFLAPKTYTENWIDVIAPTGSIIILDGKQLPLADFSPIGSQPFSVAHEQLPSGGPEGHSIIGSSPFGLVVYGYGSRTSYMVPGGLDLRVVTVPPPPPPPPPK